MYLVYIIDLIHHLMNEPKRLIFAYNSDRREYHLFCYALQPFSYSKYYALQLEHNDNIYIYVNTTIIFIFMQTYTQFYLNQIIIF
jgi:hypothetical protein